MPIRFISPGEIAYLMKTSVLVFNWQHFYSGEEQRMNHYLAVLSALVILPFALQAKPLSGSPVASGFVRFTGAITTGLHHHSSG